MDNHQLTQHFKINLKDLKYDSIICINLINKL
jgi:hypothetical protein